ncbi:DUF4198 domain-containing protein [Pseudoalteromonas arctica]|uniref:DUF4198 domain-containing protein n=1 Tax=Pseudoalteromonas arctica TaxID=394751 RepID=A0A7Y0DS36_9GAMM|nr:DUF4198 domain-containing protein [Pseudoalteromonas arctica]NMM40594.1 DUF4198 domain-containing protein [Pseudoalteromonas arctica]
MKINLLKSAFIGALTFTALASSYANAHAQWLVPSHTSLSGDKAHYVMIDASISNEIFSADKAYRPKEKGAEYDDNLIIALSPDGKPVSDKIRAYYLQRKNSAAIKLSDEGTYHIAMKREPRIMTFYKDANGERGRVFSGKDSKDIPAGATDIKSMKSFSTVDTFVSRNGTSKPALLGQGLELSGPTHPNDLFVGEQARFQLLKDGKPAANIELAILKGDTRYRNERNEVKVTTDKNGFFTNIWQQPGLYLIEASISEDSSEKDIDSVRFSLFTTLDVAPE